MEDNASAIFLHHSTGEDIWGGYWDKEAQKTVPKWIEDWINNYNQKNNKNYSIVNASFPRGMGNDPYNYWYIWVANAGESQVNDNDTLELLTDDYDVIIWKHCFTAAAIEESNGVPNVTSNHKTIENYKLQYEALKDKMHEFPNNRFLVWTNPAILECGGDSYANRLNEFVTWVRDTWDESGDNIYLWDFYELETDGGLYMNPQYSQNSNPAYCNHHPNTYFSEIAAPLMSQRLVNVVEGNGDTTSRTGE
jgi:hypothetical protein